MQILTRYIFKEHLLPFFLSLLMVFFLLFTNFLLRAVDRILGKGLELSVILEYLLLNTAHILALAAPMAVLLATLMAFGRFSEDNEITALRSSGVSFPQILWPALIFSILVAGPLTYFNNAVLPEMNHKARLLSRDIYRKRPDINIEPGYFIDDLPQYSLIVKGRKGKRFQDVRIFSKDRAVTQTTIYAREATFTTIQDAILVTLFDGEIHELDTKEFQNYRRIIFEKHQITIHADDLSLERRDSSSRTDREMTVEMMSEKVSDYEGKIATVFERIKGQMKKVIPDAEPPKSFDIASAFLKKVGESFKADSSLTEKELIKKNRTIQSAIRRLKADYQMIDGYGRSINRYKVEIHKKFSIPVACIVFVLLGAPLGVMAKKGGLATAVIFSFGFFVVYWIFLIAGEGLADRNLITPAFGMWSPNVLFALLGLYFAGKASTEQKDLFNFLRFIFRKKDQ
ncbi:MAG: LptF/LptG family permease [Candidatus Marinimicrobia bacterium]|nr:LptF/LptG family permease [Candidatus Neomarinimicrobiota bacterium]